MKQHGKQADIAQFRSQLDAQGLKIIRVTADGNCFFRFVDNVNFLHFTLMVEAMAFPSFLFPPQTQARTKS